MFAPPLLVTVAAQTAAAAGSTSYCVHNNFVVIPAAYLSRHRWSVRALGIPGSFDTSIKVRLSPVISFSR